jgi:hypothetical protein
LQVAETRFFTAFGMTRERIVSDKRDGDFASPKVKGPLDEVHLGGFDLLNQDA